MSLLYLAPLIVFIFWYTLHRFSDDVSAIESFRSTESVNEDSGDDTEKREETTVRKSNLSSTFKTLMIFNF